MYTAHLKNLEATLKEFYLPAWQNQLGIEPSALLGKIKKAPLSSDIIVASAPIGLSGGFGFGEEGRNTPAAGNVRHARFTERSKDMYVNITISQKAVKLTGNKGAMIDALDTEVKGAYDTAKWNVGRALFGDGTGKLATITAVSGNTLTVDDVTNLKEGLIIDIYASGATADSTPSCTGCRITAIDRGAKTVLVEGTVTAVADSFITVQNSFCREITGLGAIYDDSIGTLYGLAKSENIFAKPVVEDADNMIDDGIITKTLRRAKRDKGSDIDMLLCGDDAYDAYVSYLRENNVRVEGISHTIAGGFKAIKFIFGNQEVDIVNEGFVPSNEMWGVDTSTLTLHQSEWAFAELNGGGIFNLMENQSVYRALLANYGDLICDKPGGCVQIKNVGYGQVGE